MILLFSPNVLEFAVLWLLLWTKANYNVDPGRGDSHIKMMGMLVVSLGGENHEITDFFLSPHAATRDL